MEISRPKTENRPHAINTREFEQKDAKRVAQDVPETALDFPDSKFSDAFYNDDNHEAHSTVVESCLPKTSLPLQSNCGHGSPETAATAKAVDSREKLTSSARSSVARRGGPSFQGNVARMSAIQRKHTRDARDSVGSRSSGGGERASFSSIGRNSTAGQAIRIQVTEDSAGVGKGTFRKSRASIASKASRVSKISVASRRSNASNMSKRAALKSDGTARPTIRMYPKTEVVAVAQPEADDSKADSYVPDKLLGVRDDDQDDQESIFQTDLSDGSRIRASNESNDKVPQEDGKKIEFATNEEYFEYLMLSQRENSMTYLQSTEIVYEEGKPTTKFIGPYLLGDVIGKGAFGKVKEGLCSKTLKRVAVKILSKKRVKKVPNGVGKVVREIDLLSRIKHKNIITLIDVYCKVESDNEDVGILNWFSGIEDEPIVWSLEDGSEIECMVKVLKWYLVLEYCPCSLQTVIEQSPNALATHPRRHSFFREIAEGISHLHNHNIIHRDIKPANILLTPDGVIKLSDFGIAETFSMYDGGKAMKSSEFAGTHQFIPPEIADGHSNFNACLVDVWALGVSLYNMLTGSYPFDVDEGGDLLSLYESIIKAEFSITAEMDDSAQDLIKGMLRKSVEERLDMRGVLKHDWTQTYPSAIPKSGKFLAYPISGKENEVVGHGEKPTSDQAANEESNALGTVTDSQQLPAPVETTMMEYIQSLYEDEIEIGLQNTGLLEDLLKQATVDIPEDSSTVPEKHFLTSDQNNTSKNSLNESTTLNKSMKKWFKEVLGGPASSTSSQNSSVGDVGHIKKGYSKKSRT